MFYKVLTLFFPMFPLDPPENRKQKRFYDVFRGVKRKHWEGKVYISLYNTRRFLIKRLDFFKLSTNKMHIKINVKLSA